MRDRGSLISERAIWRCFIQMCDGTSRDAAAQQHSTLRLFGCGLFQHSVAWCLVACYGCSFVVVCRAGTELAERDGRAQSLWPTAGKVSSLLRSYASTTTYCGRHRTFTYAPFPAPSFLALPRPSSPFLLALPRPALRRLCLPQPSFTCMIGGFCIAT